MKKLSVFVLFSVFASTVWAGLPPTSTKFSGDAAPVTTFEFDFPNATVTHTGVKASFGVLGILGGGTGQTTAGAAFNALSCMASSGDIIYGGASGACTRLPKAADGTVLTLSGGVPAWGGAGGAPTVGTLDGQAANSDGLTVNSNVIYQQSASATNPGLVNNTTQTFSGNKTVNGTIAGVGQADAVQLTTKGVSGQTAHLQEWQTNTSTVLGWVDAGGTLRGGAGTAAVPSFSVDAGGGTAGMYFNGGSGLTFAYGGGDAFSLVSTQVKMLVPLNIGGTQNAGQAGIFFFNDTTTGLYYSGVGETSYTSGGTQTLKMSQNLFTVLGQEKVTGQSDAIQVAVKANGTQTADLQQWQDSSGTSIAKVDHSGNISGNNLSGTNTGDITLGTANGLSLTGQALSLGTASTSTTGALTSTDWNTFNGKGSGTVTAVSVASANGFAGSSSGGATPALTLSTSITGVLKGNGTALSAATSGTDYSAGTSGLATGILKSTTTTGGLSIAVAGDFPTLNQNTSGTAALATAPASGTSHGAVTLSSGGAFQSVAPGTSGNVLQSNGTDWVSASNPAGATGNYFSGYFASASTWANATSSYADGTNSGGNALTTIYSSGLTVTAAASNVNGLTFTPAASTDVFLITAKFVLRTNGGPGGYMYAKLTDGTTLLDETYGPTDASANAETMATLNGIFAPGSTSAQTVKVQFKTPALGTGGTTATLGDFRGAGTGSVYWTIVKIK